MEVQPLGLAGHQPPDLRLRQGDAVLGQQPNDGLLVKIPRSAIRSRSRHSSSSSRAITPHPLLLARPPRQHRLKKRLLEAQRPRAAEHARQLDLDIDIDIDIDIDHARPRPSRLLIRASPSAASVAEETAADCGHQDPSGGACLRRMRPSRLGRWPARPAP
ncbi:MAG: hypothetical protein M3P44_01245 [Actinomycetota bacterium]|nr:hypothetical protein [Actinomycetota bacterium]